jgi:hypothetical protein
LPLGCTKQAWIRPSTQALQYKQNNLPCQGSNAFTNPLRGPYLKVEATIINPRGIYGQIW